jgi:hypothetical protein
LPMYGFFNVLVYVRPRYLQARARVASETLRVIFGEPPSSRCWEHVRIEESRSGGVVDEVEEIQVVAKDMVSDRKVDMAVSSLSLDLDLDSILPTPEPDDGGGDAQPPQPSEERDGVLPQPKDDDE